VKNLTNQDISLLFKDLVIVPSDRIQEEFDKTPKETVKSDSQIAEDSNLTANSKQDQVYTKVAEALPKSHPFICIVPDDIHSLLMKDDSNFNRIIASLNVININKYYKTYSSFSDFSELQNFDLVLTIGLSGEQQNVISQSRQSPTHHSVNPEILNTREEKLAMFQPFKAFVTDNLGKLSQL